MGNSGGVLAIQPVEQHKNMLGLRKIIKIFIFIIIISTCIMSFLFAATIVSAPEEPFLSSPEVDDEAISENEDKKNVHVVVSSSIREVSAYNAGDVNQCWGDPCISANGENICNALALGYKRCAANFVPFGTFLEIENYGVCLVVDRMNERYNSRVDIAMPLEAKKQAISFGIKTLEVKILKLSVK